MYNNESIRMHINGRNALKNMSQLKSFAALYWLNAFYHFLFDIEIKEAMLGP